MQNITIFLMIKGTILICIAEISKKVFEINSNITDCFFIIGIILAFIGFGGAVLVKDVIDGHLWGN